ncbi:MAG: aldose 1-epimerase [Alphaproteobacteria bacterium]|nr:aldose 1-epimerase [Alphaproteobacteria bacterium]
MTPTPDATARFDLEDDGACATIDPRAGGAIAAYATRIAGRRVEWIAAPPAGSRDAGAVGCFPLVPYSNRIRDGRFPFADRIVALPTDPASDPHFEHGHGWREPWRVVDRGTRHALLQFRHEADAWPWPYEAMQAIALEAGDLVVELAVVNCGHAPMPVGLGLHPFFTRTPGMRLRAAVAGMWRTDAAVLPTALGPVPPDADLTAGATIDALDLDNVFTGWDGHAVLERPAEGARLTISATPPLRFLVVYAPPGQPYFCAEPVSNATDAFNLSAAGRDDTGLIVLAPGERAVATVRMSPGALAAP